MHFLFKKNIIKFISISVLIVFPILASAACPDNPPTRDDGLVPCGQDYNCDKIIDSTEACGFSDLMIMINGIINFLLFNVSIPLAAILFAWAGFTFVTAAGNESKISKAKEIFGAVLYGLLIAFLAWLIINTVLDALGLNSDYSYLGGP